MKLPRVLAVLTGIALSIAAIGCSTTPPAEVAPTPNIDATVEARVKQERSADATVVAKLKQEIAAQATLKPQIIVKEVPVEVIKEVIKEVPVEVIKEVPAVATPVPTPTPTPTPVPTATPTPVPTATPIPVPTPPPTSSADAITVPQLVIATVPSDLPTYDRADWKHWIDADRDCQNTRAEVLIDESSVSVGFRNGELCTVDNGRWLAPYTGTAVTVAGDLDIDHMVPLANAHRSGAWAWTAQQKEDYANDLSLDHHLIAVTASANRSKGAKGPEEWKPPDTGHWCKYSVNWITVKAAWRLSATADEWTALENMLGTCSVDVVVETGEPLPTAEAVPPTATPTPVPTATPTPVPTATPIPTVTGCNEGQVDLNLASIEELDLIIHISAARATGIVELRPFSSLDGLLNVSGIGPSRLADIKAQGVACIG